MSPYSKLYPLHVRAPGKINLSFLVGKKLNNGYHNVASLYQAVSVYEDLWAKPANDIILSYVPADIDTSGLSIDKNNLAIKAAMLMKKVSRTELGIEFRIKKNIPIAGGMGGGSADAAAAMLACNILWHLNYSRDYLCELAAEIGADVPFALTGGSAIGTGIGDKLSPALATGSFTWVLALSNKGLSTPVVYQELDNHRINNLTAFSNVQDQPELDYHILQAIRAGDAFALADLMHNDLQVAALHLLPELVDVLALGEELGALRGIVSGSGPTIAFLAEDNDSGNKLAYELKARGYKTILAHGPVAGAQIV